MRAELDERGESVGRKIRDAELRKIPYMLVVGEREQARGHGVGARAPRRGDAGPTTVDEFAERLAGAAILARVEAPQILRAPRLASA